jgi:hypothetical protein
MGTTCSVLAAVVLPQKTHGGVDLFFPATSQRNALQQLVVTRR